MRKVTLSQSAPEAERQKNTGMEKSAGDVEKEGLVLPRERLFGGDQKRRRRKEETAERSGRSSQVYLLAAVAAQPPDGRVTVGGNSSLGHPSFLLSSRKQRMSRKALMWALSLPDLLIFDLFSWLLISPTPAPPSFIPVVSVWSEPPEWIELD